MRCQALPAQERKRQDLPGSASVGMLPWDALWRMPRLVVLSGPGPAVAAGLQGEEGTTAAAEEEGVSVPLAAPAAPGTLAAPDPAAAAEPQGEEGTTAAAHEETRPGLLAAPAASAMLAAPDPAAAAEPQGEDEEGWPAMLAVPNAAADEEGQPAARTAEARRLRAVIVIRREWTWYRRRKHRKAGVLAIRRSPEYSRAHNWIEAGNPRRPRTPNWRSRVPKRTWERQIQEWRLALQQLAQEEALGLVLPLD